jgi:hypothetical protein
MHPENKGDKEQCKMGFYIPVHSGILKRQK